MRERTGRAVCRPSLFPSIERPAVYTSIRGAVLGVSELAAVRPSSVVACFGSLTQTTIVCATDQALSYVQSIPSRQCLGWCQVECGDAGGVQSMAESTSQEKRDRLIRLLEAELDFLEGGGHGAPAGQPNQQKPIFYHSPACINHWIVPNHKTECHDDCVLHGRGTAGAPERGSTLSFHSAERIGRDGQLAGQEGRTGTRRRGGEAVAESYD